MARSGRCGCWRRGPRSDLKSVVSTFREDENGFAGNWQPIAYALCVAPLTGMQRVTATSASNSAAKSVTATCPSGKRLIGLGGETAGGSGQVVLDVIRPNQGLTAAVVTAREDQNGFAGNWTVSAYAVCAVAPQGLQRVSAARQVTANEPDIVADCPAGKGLLGVGGEASGGSGQVAIETYALPGTGEPTRGVARGFEDQDGYTPAWTLTAYAICANSAQRVDNTSPFDSVGSKGVALACPAGKLATGGGAEITGGLGQVMLDDIVPTSPPTGLFAGAAGGRERVRRQLVRAPLTRSAPPRSPGSRWSLLRAASTRRPPRQKSQPARPARRWSAPGHAPRTASGR